ncbi:hypothetical protein SAMN05216533_2198 [Streptomyces sp. Ag109_O5-10]|nr:hypothetical protein SAMN05216533_2198 [Streptomyces sp. Ag109_O5-10]
MGRRGNARSAAWSAGRSRPGVPMLLGALRYIRGAEAAMAYAESRGRAFGSYDLAPLNHGIRQVRYGRGDVHVRYRATLAGLGS